MSRTARPTLVRFGLVLVIALAAAAATAALVATSVRAGESPLESSFPPALKDPDEGVRFLAALELVGSSDRNLERRLAAALERPAEPDDRAARLAARFVLDRRRGEPAPVAPAAARAPANLVLISIDTLRADHLGCYGYGRDTTPVLDHLAAGGGLFLDARSTSSWTLPAHMSMFTSLYPSFHKLDRGGAMGNSRLDDSEPVLTEALQGAGYRTAGFVTHPFLDATWGFDRGFDIYSRRFTDAAEQVRRARLWLEWRQHHAAAGEPHRGFFLFLHLIDPHEPYDAPATYQKMFTAPDYAGDLRASENLASVYADVEFESEEDLRHTVDLYDAEIRYVDTSLSSLLDALRESGWWESTAVVVTSDHGEEFRDHGSMGHKATLYGEQLRVPLIVSYPRAVAAGRTVRGTVSLVDLLPTLAEIAGVPAPPRAQGVSLLSSLTREDGSVPPRGLYAELGPLGFRWERTFYRRALVRDGYKLIYNYDAEGNVTRELYRLDADPGERRDLYRELGGSPEAAPLSRALEDFVRRGVAYNQEFRRKNRIRLDAEQMEKLRSLGYVE